jgi:hypothetical protein
MFLISLSWPEECTTSRSPVIFLLTVIELIEESENSSTVSLPRLFSKEEEPLGGQNEKAMLAAVLTLAKLDDILGGIQQVAEVSDLLAAKQMAGLAEPRWRR